MESKKIIVVEDKAIIALDIKTFLIRHGYNSTLSFLSGDMALEYLNENKPDLALIDVILHSNVDGLELAKELKKRSIPFIFVSAFSNPGQYEEAVQLNPAAIFFKPINLSEILIKIREILRNNSGKDKKINSTKNYH